MSLSKQLYGLMLAIFISMFVGNTYITIQNTKEYLELESTSKAQDTATSLGMMLKSLIKNKKDPEIASTINAIADSGFYSSIILKDMYYTFTDTELLEANKNLNDLQWEVSNVHIDTKFGKITTNDDDELIEELNEVENENDSLMAQDNTYTFVPSQNFKDGDTLDIYYDIAKGDIVKHNIKSTLKLTNILVKATRPVKFDSVPQWFINMIPIQLQEQKSQINDGWKTTAEISVKANAGVAYLKLYEQVKEAVIYSLSSFTIAITLLVLVLRLILKPLKAIETLADNISVGKFEQIKDIPWTRELKSVSIAMNMMSSKIENIINKLNSNIKEVSQQVSKDPLTKLGLKQIFENDLKNMFISKKTGFVFIAHIAELGEFAKNNGRNTVDNFLIEFAQILNSIENLSAYRFYGSEFALIFNNDNQEQLNKITASLTKQFEELGKKYNKQNVANIGGIMFNQFDTFGGVLSGASEAYEMAKQIGPNTIHIKEKSEKSRGTLAWKELVNYIIDNEKIDLKYIGDIKSMDQNNQLLVQEAFANMKDENDEAIPIGVFLSVAEENNKVIKFDQIIVKKVINYIEQNNIKHQISINLSIESIKDVQFLAWLKNIILQHKTLAPQLIFSLTAYNIAKNMEIFKQFVQLIQECHSEIMIKRFELKFIEIDEIKQIKPNCIRLAKDYTQDISKDMNKKVLVDSICKITGLLGIQLYAEGVKEDQDYQLVKQLELNGLSR